MRDKRYFAQAAGAFVGANHALQNGFPFARGSAGDRACFELDLNAFYELSLIHI